MDSDSVAVDLKLLLLMKSLFAVLLLLLVVG
jgi:hypothetical protein